MNRREVPSLYAIADRDTLGPAGVLPAVRVLVEEGVGWIQIRAKGAPGEELRRLLEDALDVASGSHTRIWIDDRVDLAAVAGAGGVHLGRDDLPASAARDLLAEDQWIGSSTHGLSQAAAASADDAVDVIAVGPILPTASKQNPDPVVGLDLLRSVRRVTEKPVVAIGGLSAETIGPALEAGADAVAVLGGICRGDVRRNTRRLLAAVGGGR